MTAPKFDGLEYGTYYPSVDDGGTPAIVLGLFVKNGVEFVSYRLRGFPKPAEPATVEEFHNDFRF